MPDAHRRGPTAGPAATLHRRARRAALLAAIAASAITANALGAQRADTLALMPVAADTSGADSTTALTGAWVPALADRDTVAARTRVARALGLDVVVDPRLVVPAAPMASAGRRDLGAASYGWCRPGARGKRTAQWAVGATFVGGNLALYEYFRNAWWSGERKAFWFNNDWAVRFRDQDKLGHFLGGYVLAEAGRELLEAACMSEKKAALWGAAYSAAFQLQIEIWDGTQRAFGFSMPDLLFNTLGQGMSLLHAFAPVTRAVLPTFSYHPTEAMRRTRAGEISSELRPTVDYSGQSYWLSIDVDTLLPRPARRWWPGILRLSVGHTITDWVLPTDGSQVRANRRWLLSLDLDPLRLPGNAPWWVTTKKLLRHYRFPAPALEITSAGLRGIPWHR